MAAIAATDLTVVISDKYIAGKRRVHEGTLAFGDGALTYSTAGIPMGATKLAVAQKFGFVRQLVSLEIFGVNERTTDYMLRYGPANGTLLMYEEEAVAAGGPLLECDTSEAPPARTYSFRATGW